MTLMHRKTATMVALATVGAALVGFFVAGSAFGSEWTEYEGRVSAGQAYLLAVPEGTEALQLAYSPGLLGSGGARATLFGPDDARIGHYVLDAENDKATLETPTAGEHVLYVFDLSGGVLTVAAKSEEKGLELVTLETRTTNLEVARQESAGAFRAVTTLSIAREPVFESLLYQGMAEGMTGTVRSLLGETSRVSGEDGVAHGPGLFTQQAGERAAFPENLAPGLRTIDALADTFEGTLYLTVVHYVRPDAVEERATKSAIPEIPENALVLTKSRQATEFTVPDGVGTLAIGLVLEEEEDEEEHAQGFGGPEHRGYRHGPEAVLAIYTPSDDLLGFVRLDEETPVAALGLVEGGDYVAYVFGQRGEGVYLALDAGAAAFDGKRHLRTSVVERGLGEVSSPLFYSESFVVEMARAPLAAGVGVRGEGSLGLDIQAVIHTTAGEVRMHNWKPLPDMPLPFFQWGHHGYAGEELVAGTWTIDAKATAATGELTLFTLEYDRAHAEAHEDEEEGF